MDFFEELAKNKPSEKDLEVALEWLSSSNEDIHACELLYKHELYASSTYHLQQAVEKSTKTMLIQMGVLKPKKLRKLIGHMTPNAFIEILKKSWAKKFIETMAQFNPNINKDAEKELTDAVKQKEEFAKLPASEIKKVLELLENIEKQTTGHMVANLAPALISSSNKFIDLYLLSFLTYPHEEYTRYPDEKTPLQPKDYTLELGIVKETPGILARLKDVNKNLKEMNKPGAPCFELRASGGLPHLKWSFGGSSWEPRFLLIPL